VPLSKRAVTILNDIGPPKKKDGAEKWGALVFPGRNKGKPLSQMGLLTLLKRTHPGNTTAI
jgi:hypothetical protein